MAASNRRRRAAAGGRPRARWRAAGRRAARTARARGVAVVALEVDPRGVRALGEQLDRRVVRRPEGERVEAVLVLAPHARREACSSPAAATRAPWPPGPRAGGRSSAGARRCRRRAAASSGATARKSADSIRPSARSRSSAAAIAAATSSWSSRPCSGTNMAPSANPSASRARRRARGASADAAQAGDRHDAGPAAQPLGDGGDVVLAPDQLGRRGRQGAPRAHAGGGLRRRRRVRVERRDPG